jgi:hypothetical protein
VTSLQAGYFRRLAAFEAGLDGAKKPQPAVDFIGEHEELDHEWSGSPDDDDYPDPDADFGSGEHQPREEY